MRKMLPYVFVTLVLLLPLNEFYRLYQKPPPFQGDILICLPEAQRIIQDGQDYPLHRGSGFMPHSYPIPKLLADFYLLPHITDYQRRLFVLLPLALLPALCFALLLKINRRRQASYWLPAILSLLCLWEFIQFDLRAVNINLLLLALVLASVLSLQKKRPWLAGLLLGISVTLKIYSVFLLPLWLLRREYRAVAATVGVLFCCFIVLPIGFLGMERSYALTINWLETMRQYSAPQLAVELRCYLVSTQRAVVYLLGGSREMGAASLAPATWQTLALALKIWQFAWLAFVGWVVWQLRRPDSAANFQRQTALLLIAPLPLSPLLQPHHLVLFIPAFLQLFTPLSAAKIAWRQVAAVAAIAGLMVLPQFIRPPEASRGLLYALVAFGCGLFFLLTREKA